MSFGDNFFSSEKSKVKTSNKLTRRNVLIAGSAAYLAAAAPARAQTVKRYDAIVVGSGLSGLHAARLLEEQGLNVLVLEGRNRIGGRVYTLMDIPGKPEAAGELIGGNYARMLDTARRLKLELFEPETSFVTGSTDKVFRIKGQNISPEDWPNHPLNPLKGDDRLIPPDRLLWTLSHRNNPLSGRALDDWILPEFAKYDIPHSEYMKKFLGMNDETIRLMNTVIHSNHIDNTSALNELRRYAVGEFNSKMSAARPDLPDVQQIKGGNSLITDAMAASLKNEVRLQKTVHGFDDTGDEVTVHCTDGTSYKAKQVVCSMPYSVMRHVKFSNRPSALLEGAIAEIDYGISIQVHFLIKRNFWEEDGLSSNMWTDTPFERFVVLRNNKEKTPTSALAYINGNEAFKYDFMTDKQAMQYTLQELIKVRPSIEGALEPILVQSCHRNVHGAGDWVYWKPGQVTKYAAHMREPHGNIHFAGEHTALLERGMEGAFESGERAAFDLLGRM